MSAMQTSDAVVPRWSRAALKQTVVRSLIGSARPSNGNGGAPPRLRSRLPLVGEGLALLVDPVTFQRLGHQTLGDVFTVSLFGQPLTFVTGAEAVARVASADNQELDLVGAYKKLVGRLVGEDLFADVPSTVLKELSGASVRRRSGPLAAFAERFLAERIGKGGEIDALRLCSDVVMHMACRFVCGDAIGVERCDELTSLFDVLESDYSVLGLFLPVETPSMRRRVRARERIVAIFEEEVRRAAARDDLEEGYMRTVLETLLAPDPRSATPEQYRSAALAIMGAVFGAHTNTAMSLAVSLCDLLQHPEVLASVRDEQQRVLGAGAVDLGILCQMPMLLSAINESMRLRGGGGLWRLTHRPVELGGHLLPAGSLVSVSMSLLNRDPDIYSDPERYAPARYRDMKTDDFQSPSIKERRFGTFGIGRHVCPGRGLAYVIVASALTSLLRGFSVEPVRTPWRWLELITAGIARPVGRFRVRLTPVNSEPLSAVRQ
jgi:cytochrome P450